LSWDLAVKLLDIIRQLEINSLIIIGGEPTIWRYLLKFNRLCREKKILSTLVTNGFRFSNDQFWNNYLKDPNDKVSPSIKAFDGKSLLKLAKVRGIEAVKKGIGRLVKMYDCNISFVISSYIIDDLTSMVQFAKVCGASKVSLSPCTPSFSDDGISTDGMVPLEDLVKAVVAQYPQLHKLMSGNLTLSIKRNVSIPLQHLIS